MAGVDAHVVEAELELSEGVDPASVGAAVTVELCGHWNHEPPCRWPHNNAVDAEREPARFRTVFVAEDADVGAVRDRIGAALSNAPGWRLISAHSRSPHDDERALAESLLTGPRLS